MKNVCSCTDGRAVYPILVKNGGNAYWTLYYYTGRSDVILHGDTKNLLYFRSKEETVRFCESRGLTIENGAFAYDFDSPVSNPIDYKRVLDNWNLLNTAADTLGMFFEGNEKKHTGLYNLLFRLNTPAVPISPTYRVCDKYLKQIGKVFRKKDRFFERFVPYGE